MKDGEKSMPNREENALMLDLMMLRNALAKRSGAVRERLRVYPQAWRDMRLLWYLVNKLQNQLLSTMPDRRQLYYEKMARLGKVTIDIPGPIPKDRHLLITETGLAAITDAAMRGECALCIRKGRDAQKCPIRSALLEVAPPGTVNDGRDAWAGCEYQEAASAVARGEEIWI